MIVMSLSGMLLAGMILLFVSGPTVFWIFGLILCLFVGPACSPSRTFLARLAPTGQEGNVRAVRDNRSGGVVPGADPVRLVHAFRFGSDQAGIIGILLVLAGGLAALWPVRPPEQAGRLHAQAAG